MCVVYKEMRFFIIKLNFKTANIKNIKVLLKLIFNFRESFARP